MLGRPDASVQCLYLTSSAAAASAQCAAAKPCGDDVVSAEFGAARLRLDVPHLGEIPLQAGEQLPLGAALEAPWRQRCRRV